MTNRQLDAYDGREGLRRALEETWDVLILDRLLPHVDGLEIVRELRQAGINPSALGRRSRTTAAKTELRVDDLELDLLRRTARRGNFAYWSIFCNNRIKS